MPLLCLARLRCCALAAAHKLALSLDEPMAFTCFDARLNKAAKVLDLIMLFGDKART